MLRIHFTPADVTRLRVAGEPDPLWETVLSLFRVRRGDGPMVLRQWRRRAIERCDKTTLQMLMPLTPGGYFPDFLNPAESRQGFDAGLEAVLSTPRQRLRSELDLLGAQRKSLPSWACQLADGDAETMTRLGNALRTYHETVIAPYWPEIRAQVEADRAKRARALLDGGFEELINSFQPMMRWRPPVLEVDVPYNDAIHLDGRGLLLIPSYLSWGGPDKLKDPALPPVLVYPVEHDVLLSARSRDSDRSLAALIGPTRAAILDTIQTGRSTTELARRVGVSAGSVSQHTAVMRDAGLILTTRVGKAVIHTLTPTGVAVLNASGDPERSESDRLTRSR
jgi:DNA-binding transcriptional ArsR family regulator